MSIDIPSMLVGIKSGSPVGANVRSFLIGKAVGGSPTPPTPTSDKWATDSWATIRAASKAGLTADAYGDQIGTTRNITLADNTVVTLRLSNATTDLYSRSDGSGTTGLVVEFAQVLQNAAFYATATNVGGWKDSDMRSVVMPSIFALLPSDLKAVIETVDIVSGIGGGVNDIVTSEDKLFLLAVKETLGDTGNSTPSEANALKKLQFYVQHHEAADKIKNTLDGNASTWWTRSANIFNDTSFISYAKGGWPSTWSGKTVTGVSPAFCI